MTSELVSRRRAHQLGRFDLEDLGELGDSVESEWLAVLATPDARGVHTRSSSELTLQKRAPHSPVAKRWRLDRRGARSHWLDGTGLRLCHELGELAAHDCQNVACSNYATISHLFSIALVALPARCWPTVMQPLRKCLHTEHAFY